MDKWYMLTLIGKDRAGIVAHVAQALYEGGCNLGEASMLRLGDSFTIMMMVSIHGAKKDLELLLTPVTQSLGLHLHIDKIDGHLHRHVEPNAHIVVHGTDRPGIVAHAIGALAEAGLNIINLDTDVGGSEKSPIYIMRIDGVATEGLEALQSALTAVSKDGVDAKLTPIETMIG